MDRIIKSDRLCQDDKLKLYYFPDIPIANSSRDGEGSGTEDSFRRIDFEENSAPAPDISERPQENGEYIEGIKEKARDIEERAYIEGFTQGERAGFESAKKKLELILNDFRQALLELDKIKKEISLNAEREMVELALAIARKIVCHEVSINKEVVLSVIKEALKKVVDHEKIKIRMNPSDLEFIKNAKFHFSNLVDNIESITFEEDETILNGGCVIETNLGDIDARIERQLRVVEEAFKSELQKSRFRG